MANDSVPSSTYRRHVREPDRNLADRTGIRITQLSWFPYAKGSRDLDELEREVSALRQSIRYRRQIQQAENAQFGAGHTSSVARAVEEYRPCVVCKHRVLAAEWRAHCGKCIVDVVRHSVMASSGERLDSSIGGSPKRAQAATTMR